MLTINEHKRTIQERIDAVSTQASVEEYHEFLNWLLDEVKRGMEGYLKKRGAKFVEQLVEAHAEIVTLRAILDEVPERSREAARRRFKRKIGVE